MDRIHRGPPLHDTVIAQLHEAPEKFSDHATKIQILCEDIMACREALRAVAAVHTGTHYCSPVTDYSPPHVWAAGWWCPTYTVVAATLSGYGRGGSWPKDEYGYERGEEP